MIQYLLNYKNIIPDEYLNDIFEVDYKKHYQEGKRVIITDLDNTLISYKATEPNEKLFNWKRMVEDIGFEVIIASNSKKKRVKYFSDLLNNKYVSFSTKPLKRGFKKALKRGERKYKPSEVLELGDQLMTDVYGSRRMGFYTILVKAIDKKTERPITRFNRKIEKKMLKRAQKKNKALYDLKLRKYVEDTKC